MNVQVCEHCMELKTLKPVIVYIDNKKAAVAMCSNCREAFKKLCAVYHIENFRSQRRKTLQLIKEARA